MSTVESTVYEQELIKALEFYANHNHWMTLGQDADALHSILVAHGQSDGYQGWSEAEDALARYRNQDT